MGVHLKGSIKFLAKVGVLFTRALLVAYIILPTVMDYPSEILDKELLTNLMMGSTCKQSFKPFPIRTKSLCIKSSTATNLCSYGSGFLRLKNSTILFSHVEQMKML